MRFRRSAAFVDADTAAAHAAARREAAAAEVERMRLMAQLDRERQDAAAEQARRRAIAEDEERQRRAAVRRRERAESSDRRRKARAAFAAKVRPALPLLLINGGAAYAQAAYAFSEIAPATWTVPPRLAFALAFALALESIAVYVQWHAHDALMLKAHATAASLRKAAWLIAAVVAAINYAHFADGIKPTAAAVAFALLSLLSPWLWGLHTRRAQHMQLLAEDSNLIDDAGVEFSPKRRRAFPIRSRMAERWSIEHNERDPRKAWEGYNTERAARRAAAGTNRTRAAWHALTGKPTPTPALRPVAVTGPAPAAEPAPEPVVVDQPTPVEPVAPAPVEPVVVERVTPRSLTAAQRVTAAHDAEPAATHERIADLARVSVSTVKRHRPRTGTGSPSGPNPAETPAYSGHLKAA
ncbi:hypothetical protein [Polymorphospora lycopeni]|uniref:DUF2637 domain-containing protein n=1 Tax=Polymorphospora lycopeni TaxID=3140240 RepID=A0ABV5D419_9ACTN